MSSIRPIAIQVKRNCDISDAGFWGFYSPCGLLMRMRDLFRIEQRLRPWDIIDDFRIRGWIDRKEYLWEELESAEFQPITIDGGRYDPFDAASINRALTGSDYHYSSGYGISLKPIFLLAKVRKEYNERNVSIVITEREAARDLSSVPAMTLGRTITVRKETVRFFLWDRYEETKSGRCSPALTSAFAEYGIYPNSDQNDSTTAFRRRFSRMVEAEMPSFVHHETGGASQKKKLGRWWNRLIMSLPHSRAEFFLRALADVLADTSPSGPLAAIVRDRRAGSLAFFKASLRGFRKNIFPGMDPAWQEFTRTGSWDLIEQARKEGFKEAAAIVAKLKEMCRGRMPKAGTIEKVIMQPVLKR